MSISDSPRWAEERPELFDGRRAARRIARGEPPEAEGDPVTILAERALGLRELSAAAGQFEADDRLMRLAVASPLSLGPGDRIRETDGRSWVVILVRTAPGGAAAQAIVRRWPWRQAEAALVDLYRADYAKAASGEADVAWVLQRSAVAVRMQPLDRAVEQGERAAAPRFGERLLVYFDEVLFRGLEELEPLDHRWRLRDALGRWYGVIGVRDRGQLDRPPVVEVEAIR